MLVWGWAPWYRWKYRHIPGYMGLPLVGNVPDVILHNGLVPLYRKAHKRFGRVFMVRRLSRTFARACVRVYAHLGVCLRGTQAHVLGCNGSSPS